MTAKAPKTRKPVPRGPAAETAPKTQGKPKRITPSYSAEFIADIVQRALEHVEDGLSLNSFCEAEGLRFGTVWRWIEASDDENNSLRAQAMLRGTHALASKVQQVIENAKPETASADRVKVDGYLRLAGLWNRRDYGEKKEVDMNVRQMPDWSMLSPEAKAEIRAALEAQIKADGLPVPAQPLGLPDASKG